MGASLGNSWRGDRVSSCTAATAPGLMEDKHHKRLSGLLKEQLAFFVQHGFLVLRPSLPEGEDAVELHSRIANAAHELDRKGELGNNVLPLIPELGTVLDAPEIAGALRALLGEDYVMMPHRHCHVADEGCPAQPFHRDSFFGFEQFRHSVPMELMLNYYPRPVSRNMGPTALLPGSQYAPGTKYRGGMEFAPGDWGDMIPQLRCITNEPGLCVLMHYHLWHRGTGRSAVLEPWDAPVTAVAKDAPSQPTRWMFKIQFRRTRGFRKSALSNEGCLDASCARSNNDSSSSGSNIGAENPYFLVLKDQRQGGHQGLTAKQTSGTDEKATDCTHAYDAGDTALLLSKRLQTEFGTGGEPKCDGCTSKAMGLPAPLCFVDGTVRVRWALQQLPTWAGVWAVLTGYPLQKTPWSEEADRLASPQIADDVPSALEGTAWQETASPMAIPMQFMFGKFDLAELVARLTSDSCFEEKLFAAHAISIRLAASGLDPESVLSALLPVLQAVGENADINCREQSPATTSTNQESDTDSNKASDCARNRELIREEAKPGHWGRTEEKALVAWTQMHKHKEPLLDEMTASDPQYLAAAVLQQCPAPLRGSKSSEFAALVRGFGSPNEWNDIECQLGDWRLEALLAVPAVLHAGDALACLAQAVCAPMARVQLHACMAIYACGVRCGAPDSAGAAGWRESWEKYAMEDSLLRVISFWVEDFAPRRERVLKQSLKRRKLQSGDARRERPRPVVLPDSGGRYALAEALRCMGRFGSREGLEHAVVLSQAEDMVGMAEADGTLEKKREYFLRFLERRWLCPLTMPYSPF